jgi:hypothetical protein
VTAELVVAGGETVVGVVDEASAGGSEDSASAVHAEATISKAIPTRAISIHEEDVTESLRVQTLRRLLFEILLPGLDGHLQPVLDRRDGTRVALAVDTRRVVGEVEVDGHGPVFVWIDVEISPGPVGGVT